MAKTLNISPTLKDKKTSEFLPTDNYDVFCCGYPDDWTQGNNVKVYPGYNLLVIEGKKAKHYFGIVTKDIEMYINPSQCTIDSIPNQTYAGSEIRPIPIVRSGTEIVYATYDKKTISYPKRMSGEQYTPIYSKEYPSYRAYSISYSNNIDVGIATITISPTKSSASSKTIQFQIVPCHISDSSITLTGAVSQIEYKGVPVTYPALVVKFNKLVLDNDVDYKITYASNNDLGIATATIEGKGNFDSSRTTTFKVVGNLSDAQILDNASSTPIQSKQYSYTGSNVQPTIKVNLFTKNLVQGTHFSLAWPETDYIWPGQKSGQITAITSRNCIGSKTFSFNVIGSIQDVVFSNTVLLYKKTGSQIKPATDAIFHGKTLTSGTDYQVSYPSSNYINKGSKIICFTGKGFYSGTKDFEYAIYDDSQTQVFKTTGEFILLDDATTLTRAALGVTSSSDATIQKVVIGTSVTSLANGLFAHFTSLVEVDMHLCSTNVEIPEGCFEGCSRLTTLRFPGT